MVHWFGFRNQPPLPRQRATSISAGVIRLYLQPGRRGAAAGFGTMNDQTITIGERHGWHEPQPFGIAAVDERQHIYIIGKTGSGKTTLLRNLIVQHIMLGHGVGVIDPHGDLAEELLNHIPPRRADHLVYFNPGDVEFPIGMNVIGSVKPDERHLVASGSVGAFKAIWRDSWGPRLEYILYNAVSALLECRNQTLLGVNRLLTDDNYRAKVIRQIKDPFIRAFWAEEYASYDERFKREAIAPIQNKIGQFLLNPVVRNILGQVRKKVDIPFVMDNSRLFLARLPEGILGRENSHLLGTLMVSKFQQIAMSRQAQQIESRRLFNIYIDEFANFITPSMAEILSGARKYRIGLTLAHHELHQLQRSPEVASAVMTHPYTRIVFRVGDDDAKKLAEGFSFFESKDLRNLETGQAVCRVERSDFDFNLSVPLFPSPDAAAVAARRQEVTTRSREKYGTPRADVEAMLAMSRGIVPPSETSSSPPAKPVAKGPKAAEVPKAAVPPPVVEMPPPVVAEIPKTAVPPPAIKHEPPRDSGRGGAQHQAIQKRIKDAAEALGFRSVIEKPVLDGQGSVDLWLERTGEAIACEISISTTVDHEVRNVSKCLKAGVPKVAVICLDDERLRKIRTAVSGSLGAEPAARVEYFQPDPFIAYLKALPPPTAQPSESEFSGYKIKRTIPKLSAEEQRQKEDIANQAMREAMRRKKP
jgi:hypothetical protein